MYKDVISKNFNECWAIRKKLEEYFDVEFCLLKWFYQRLDKKMSIIRSILLEKAEEFGHKLRHEHFKGSNGWLTN